CGTGGTCRCIACIGAIGLSACLLLEQWAHLADVDTSSVPPSAQTILQAMPLREDTAEPSLTADEALRNAPARSGDFVRVQAILSEEADG
ncbi:MAG: aspartyl/glutamyl-tRNA amidotransferase subunit C, partial [Candidatus Limnocylindrus sp.]